MSRGIHSLPNNGATNDWITPQYLLSPLGEFDLDPCAHPTQPWQTAERMIQPPDDGLLVNWTGRVWLNPPYGSQLKRWLRKLAEHGNGIALVPSRTEVEEWFWPYIWESADAVLFLRGRLCFYLPNGTRTRRDGTKTGNAGHGSVLAAYGAANVTALEECGHPGKLIRLKA